MLSSAAGCCFRTRTRTPVGQQFADDAQAMAGRGAERNVEVSGDPVGARQMDC